MVEVVRGPSRAVGAWSGSIVALIVVVCGTDRSRGGGEVRMCIPAIGRLALIMAIYGVDWRISRRHDCSILTRRA